MKKRAFLISSVATITILLLSPGARAGTFTEFSLPQVQPSVITPMDTFTFSITGFNSANTIGYVLGTGELATFGTTQTFPAAGYNGQDYTITSSEVIGATTTVDTITVSTPTNFLTTTTVNGTTITRLSLNIGNANSGVGVATGADPLNYLTDVTGATSTGFLIYGAGNTQFTLSPTLTLPTTMSITDAEGVSNGTTAISTIAVHQFTFNISYPTLAVAPEPSTWAMCGLGLIGGAVVILRRRRAA